MGLSEHEQQLLDDMERRLYQSEADVMQAPSGVKRTLNLRSLVLGIVLAIVGIGVLVGGVASQQLWIGLIGFGCMLGGVVLASSMHGVQGDDGGASVAGAKPGSSSAKGRREGLSERMSRRWDERMDGDR